MTRKPMRQLFEMKSWRDGLDTNRVKSIDERTKAYWEGIYGKRATFDLQAAAQIVPPEPAIVCQHCSDIGFFVYNVLPNDPLFGKTFNCQHCEKGVELSRDQWRKRYAMAELPRQFQAFTFESWDATVSEEAKTGKWEAYYAAWQFVENAGHEVDLTVVYEQCGRTWEEGRELGTKNSLVFYGDYGTGKTGLMCGVANELLERGVSVLYVRVHDLIEDVQDTYSADSEQTTKEILQKYKTAPVLLIDEFNIHKTSADKLDKIEQIIRYRYNNNLPTLITTNLDQTEFKRLWSDRAGVAVVAMAHWIKLEGAVLRRSDPPVNDEQWWQR